MKEVRHVLSTLRTVQENRANQAVDSLLENKNLTPKTAVTVIISTSITSPIISVCAFFIFPKPSKIYQELLNKKIEVLYDDREISAGEKFADADLIGIPWRVVVSQKSLGKGGVEVKERRSEKTEILKIGELLNKLEK